MTTFAILPVKGFGQAKTRLRARVPDGPRAGLAEAMVRDVLDTLAATPALDRLLVVTGEPIAARLARDAGAEVVHDPVEAGQSAAVTLGVQRALELGADRVLAVPGDCPALSPTELAALLAAPEAIVIVPDRHGTGTNALLLAPPDAMAPSFGEGSRARHEAAAQASGRAWTVREIPGLGMDADTPDDLATLEASGRLGAQTRDALERL